MLSKLALTVILAGPFLSAPLASSQSNDPGGAQFQAPAAAASADASADAAQLPKSVVSKHGKKKKKKAQPAPAKTG